MERIYRVFRPVSQTITENWEEEVIVKVEVPDGLSGDDIDNTLYDLAAEAAAETQDEWTEVPESREREPYYKYPDEQRDGDTEVEVIKTPTVEQIANAVVAPAVDPETLLP